MQDSFDIELFNHFISSIRAKVCKDPLVRHMKEIITVLCMISYLVCEVVSLIKEFTNFAKECRLRTARRVERPMNGAIGV